MAWCHMDSEVEDSASTSPDWRWISGRWGAGFTRTVAVIGCMLPMMQAGCIEQDLSVVFVWTSAKALREYGNPW